MDRKLDDTTTNATTVRPAAARNRRRFAALGAAFALAAVGTGAMVAGSGGAADDTRPTAAVTSPTTTSPLDDLVEVADTTPPANPGGGTSEPKAPAPQPQPPVDDEPTDEQPAEDDGPAEPDTAPGELAVSTGLIELPAKTWAGTFQVRNDGGSPIDWQWAAGAAGISVSHTGGTLQPGEFVEVAFTIDHTVLPAGDFLFANCVYTADEAKDVRIEGTKTIAKNPQIELPDPVFKP